MNKTDNTQQVRHRILVPYTYTYRNRHNNDQIIKDINIKTIITQTLFHS